MPIKGSAPAKPRAELDFLREEGDDRPSFVTISLIAVGVLACATLMFLLIRGLGGSEPSAPPVATTQTAAQTAPSGGNAAPGPARYRPAEVGGTPVLVREMPLPRARPSGPDALGSATLPRGVDFPSLVKVSNAQLTIIYVDGRKQVLGKVDIHNQSEQNVLDFRLELVWGPKTYVVVPMTGSARQVRPMVQRSLRTGGKMGFQVASELIENSPAGAPHSMRLLCWLDGKPNNSLDEYILR